MPDPDSVHVYASLDDAVIAWRAEVRYTLDALPDGDAGDEVFLEHDTALHALSNDEIAHQVLAWGHYGWSIPRPDIMHYLGWVIEIEATDEPADDAEGE
jgi:hypothetical protein